MPDADELIKHPANDLGGRPAEPLVIGDHELLACPAPQEVPA